MTIIAVDPGATSGWVAYDEQQRRIVACGHFPRHHIPQELLDRVLWVRSPVVFESLEEPHANIFPATVLSAIDEGRMREQVLAVTGIEPQCISRHCVKQTLSKAVHNEPYCVTDSDVWKALRNLHGPGSDQKRTKARDEGCIGLATSHERAALAVAVAWAIQQGHWKP